MSHVHSISGDSPREGDQQNQQKSANQHTPVAPDILEIHIFQHWYLTLPGDHTGYQITFLTLDIYTVTTRQQEKSASASSFHHQAAAPNQHQLPVSTTRQQHHISQPPARHPANQLLTLLPCHTHIMAARSVVV